MSSFEATSGNAVAMRFPSGQASSLGVPRIEQMMCIWLISLVPVNSGRREHYGIARVRTTDKIQIYHLGEYSADRLKLCLAFLSRTDHVPKDLSLAHTHHSATIPLRSIYEFPLDCLE
jgi:hypothetical protein